MKSLKKNVAMSLTRYVKRDAKRELSHCQCVSEGFLKVVSSISEKVFEMGYGAELEWLIQQHEELRCYDAFPWFHDHPKVSQARPLTNRSKLP